MKPMKDQSVDCRDSEVANIHLMAAAPDLYKALAAFVVDVGDWNDPLAINARAALAKARGKT